MREYYSWDDYYIEMAELVATRSGCLSRQVGCVLVKDNEVLATGYNSTIPGMLPCKERDFCLREGCASGADLQNCFAVHAEQSVLCQCAKLGVSCRDATLYLTTQPCSTCLKMLIQAGVKRIIYRDPYPDELSQIIADRADIEMRQFTRK